MNAPGYSMEKTLQYFKEKKHSRIYWMLPLITAVTVRIIYFVFFINSPYKFYHLIKGLDMYSVFNRYPDGNVTVYYLFLRIIDFFTQPSFFIETVIVVQLIFGVAVCLFIVYICKQLTNNNKTASLAGIIYALYAPALMYEGFILKESFYLFFAVFILFMCFYTVSNKYSSISVFVLGFIILIPGLVRSVGGGLALIIFCWFIYSLIKYVVELKSCYKGKIKIIIKRVICFFLGLLLMLAAVYISCGNNLPPTLSLFSNLSYFVKVGQQKELTSININRNIDKTFSKNKKINNDNILSPKKSKWNIFIEKQYGKLKIYIRNFLFIFRAYEIPNNLNYYFIRYTLMPLKYLIGPIFLFPVGLAGFIILLLGWKKYRKPELLLLFCLPVIAGCMIFLPIARYRIVIIPILVILASVFVVGFIDYIIEKRYKKLVCGGIMLIFLTAIQVYSLQDYYLRASDYISYGQALRYQNPKDPLILNCFKNAYSMRPDLSFTKKNLIVECLRTGDFKQAESLLKDEYKRSPYDFSIAMNYIASLMGTKQYDRVFEVLSNLKEPKDVHRLGDYYFSWGEYYFFTDNYQQALEYYNRLLKIIEPKNRNIRNFINRRIYVINMKEKRI